MRNCFADSAHHEGVLGRRALSAFVGAMICVDVMFIARYAVVCQLAIYNNLPVCYVPTMMQTPEQAWAERREAVNLARLADHLKISRMAVSQWKIVPSGRFIAVAGYIGIDPRELRPDLYPERKNLE